MKKKNLRIERKQQRENENRLFILNAAEMVFAQKGYTIATMDDIAIEAQFSKATLYRYFKSKQDILFKIILNSFEEVNAKLKKIYEKGENSEVKLKEITRFILQYYHRKKNISRILLMEKSLIKNMLNLNPEEKDSIPEPERKFFEEVKAEKKGNIRIMRKIFEEGIEAGEFRRMNTLDAAHVFEALLHGFYFTRFGLENQYSFEKGSHLIHDFFLHGIKKDRKA